MPFRAALEVVFGPKGIREEVQSMEADFWLSRALPVCVLSCRGWAVVTACSVSCDWPMWLEAA